MPPTAIRVGAWLHQLWSMKHYNCKMVVGMHVAYEMARQERWSIVVGEVNLEISGQILQPFAEVSADIDEFMIRYPFLLRSILAIAFEIVHKANVEHLSYQICELPGYLIVCRFDAWRGAMHVQIHGLGINTHVSAT